MVGMWSSDCRDGLGIGGCLEESEDKPAFVSPQLGGVFLEPEIRTHKVGHGVAVCRPPSALVRFASETEERVELRRADVVELGKQSDVGALDRLAAQLDRGGR